MSHRPLTKKCFCNIYSIDDNLSVVVEATVREIWQRAWDPRSFFYIPNLISCPLPEYFVEKEHLAVSVVNSACRGSDEAIRVRRTKPPKNGKSGIAVCVKVWIVVFFFKTCQAFVNRLQAK